MRNFPHYFDEAYYRYEKERAITISGYMILRQFTGVSIPKLEQFLGISEEEQGEPMTVDDVKRALVAGGGIVIEGFEQ